MPHVATMTHSKNDPGHGREGGRVKDQVKAVANGVYSWVTIYCQAGLLDFPFLASFNSFSATFCCCAVYY